MFYDMINFQTFDSCVAKWIVNDCFVANAMVVKMNRSSMNHYD